MKVDVPKKVLISEYKWLYENKKTSLGRSCDICPIGKYKRFSRDVYMVLSNFLREMGNSISNFQIKEY